MNGNAGNISQLNSSHAVHQTYMYCMHISIKKETPYIEVYYYTNKL